MAPFDLSVIVSIALFVPLSSYLTFEISKSWLKVNQGHWKWCYSKALVRFSIRMP